MLVRSMIGMTVCSGIGAPEVSAPWIDWRYQSEIEPFPCAVLAHRFPGTVNLGDMTKFGDWPDAAIDVLCGGTPCQSFSVAGLRKGLDDPRGNLMLTYLAIADRYRPKWLVWENVPGVLSSNGGRDFGAFLGGLGQLGYGFAYRVLDAQYVRTRGFTRAVPQRRRRVFVVGHLGDWRRAAAVLFDRESLSGNSAPRREAGKAAPTIPSRSTGGGGLGTDFDCDGGLIADVSPTLRAGGNRTGGDRPPGTDVDTCETLIPSHDPACTLTAREYKGPLPEADLSTVVAHTLRGEGLDASEDGTGRQNLVPIAQGVALRGREGGATAELTGPVPPALRASQGGGDKPHVLAIQERAVSENPDNKPQAVAFDTTQITSAANRSNPKMGDPCHPLAAGAHAPAIAFNAQQDPEVTGDRTGPLGASSPQAQAIATPWAVRRLTVLECERLQGFPEGWTQVPYRSKPAADGPRYKSLGNSWAVNCGEWIFDRIRMVESISGENA